jgi:FkbM family methyltransferase
MTITLRQEGFEQSTWNSVRGNNEYGMRPHMVGIVVIDVGAHSGSFALTCLERSADFVYAYEPEGVNYLLLVNNVSDYENVECHKAAVWRSDGVGQSPSYFHGVHTGAGQCREAPGQPSVEWTSLDNIIARAHARFPASELLLKMDCEGSEYPILLTAKMLGKVDMFIGEFHPSYEQIAGLPKFDKAALVKAWADAGKVLRMVPEEIGHMWVES